MAGAKMKAGAVLLAALGVVWLIAGGRPSAEKTPGTEAAAMTTARPPQAHNPGVPAGQTFLMADPAGPIADRAVQARADAKAQGWSKGFWLGFGIRRLMGEHSSMGWYPWGGPETHVTLDDLINGLKTPLEKKAAADQAVRGTAASMPGPARSFAARRRGDEPERPVMKEIAILFRWGPEEAGSPADIRISNLDLPFDFEALPFIWAGPATDAESLDYLMSLYGRAARAEDKRSLLWAIGLHRNAPVVVPFIERILAGRESEEIRAEAASCLGEQNDPRALDLLLKTIKADPSGEVREQAVEGLVEMELPAAAEALISLAFRGADGAVRIEAVRGLAEEATAAATDALVNIAGGDKDPEIRKEAIHALADLPARAGLPYLVNLVRTHADREVRKEAVDAIGSLGGAEAVRTLKELARGRSR